MLEILSGYSSPPPAVDRNICMSLTHYNKYLSHQLPQEPCIATDTFGRDLLTLLFRTQVGFGESQSNGRPLNRAQGPDQQVQVGKDLGPGQTVGSSSP